jgi:predicted RNA-binding Zn-ribbon protein involved in translation (DUF1610 family)
VWLILAIVIVGTVLTTYVMVERRINLRPCPECGFRASIDGLDEDCPRCGAMIPRHEQS